jgi:hypothetical protein
VLPVTRSEIILLLVFLTLSSSFSSYSSSSSSSWPRVAVAAGSTAAIKAYCMSPALEVPAYDARDL